MLKETRVYLLDIADTPEGRVCNLSEEGKNDFITKAENLGNVYSLLGFQKALNRQSIDIDNYFVLITEV